LIDGFDVVLIDGDHNWYTVFNELRLIEERCKELSRPFPFVMLHDIGWPYGRRDLYYDPGTIPKEHRQLYERKGMHPKSTGLLAQAGLNRQLHNALSEGEPRSGVLTAVEDFMVETELQFELLKIPGLNGFGLLFRSTLKEQNKALTRFLSTLDLPESVAQHIEEVERARIDTQIKLSEANRLLQETRRQLQQTRREIADMQSSRSWRIVRTIDLSAVKLRSSLKGIQAKGNS
jgi:hypothetical protein